MLDHGREALQVAEGMSRRDLEADRIRQLALVRLLEIVGEAASRVPAPVRAEHTNIDWSQIVAFRNRLAHGYDVVDLDVVWLVLQSELPQLVRQLEHIVPDL